MTMKMLPSFAVFTAGFLTISVIGTIGHPTDIAANDAVPLIAAGHGKGRNR